MRNIFCFLLIIACISPLLAQKELKVTLKNATKVTTNGEGGLYFAGTRDVNYRFSQRITPHGDCLDVINGYAFVTWYKGGMDKRNLMLSRKNLNIENSDWVTIEFPHQHVGQGGELFEGSGIRGDSHNTAAIGISTIDNTIHILYDMHAYSQNSLPSVFFNYSISKKNMAFVADSEFTLDIFNPKRNYLKQGQNYDRMTYPMLHRADDGSLIARFRKGGSGNGDILLAHYNGTSWSNNWTYHEGTLPVPNRNNMYGGERFLNGKFYTGFSIRYSTNNNTSTSNGYMLNSGLYFAYTNEIPKNASTQWFNVKNQPITLPIKNNINFNSDPVQFAQPGDEYGTTTLPRTSNDPAWTVTENGAIHFVTTVDNTHVHYYKKDEDASFSSSSGGLIPNPEVRGEVYSYKNHVFMVELKGKKINIKTTLEGENNWKIIYTGQEDDILYEHFDAFVKNDKLYVYLMEDTNNNIVNEGDKRPLYFQEFTLSEAEPTEENTADIILEAEDFTQASDNISVSNNAAASGGKIISPFSGNQFLEYKFQVDNAGTYDFNLYAANRNRDDSIMDIEINGTKYSNTIITRTFDWNVFLATTISNITLNQGENNIKITQKRSLSSTPDKIELELKFSLSTNIFNKENIVVYPNPSSGIFKINTFFKDINYELINIQGSVLEEGKIMQQKVDFSNYAKGMYLLKLSSSNNGNFIKKIFIK